MTTPFFLIDFENVQPKALGRLQPGAARIKVFLGQHQSRLMLELVQALQPFGKDAEYIQITGSGPDAVDFHIAFYIGRLASAHPGATFTIVSKDRGFDPLVKHLETLGIECRRVPEIPESATTAPAKAKAAKQSAAAKKAAKKFIVTGEPPAPAPPIKPAGDDNNGVETGEDHCDDDTCARDGGRRVAAEVESTRDAGNAALIDPCTLQSAAGRQAGGCGDPEPEGQQEDCGRRDEGDVRVVAPRLHAPCHAAATRRCALRTSGGGRLRARDLPAPAMQPPLLRNAKSRYGSLPMIPPISSLLKARRVSIRMLPALAIDSMNAVAACSSSASTIVTRS